MKCKFFKSWHLICSSDGFTNILTLQIYAIECCYLHDSKYIRISKWKNSVSQKKIIDSYFLNWSNYLLSSSLTSKVHIFWEGHKILRNLPLTFDCSTYSQKLGKISQNFVAFSEYMNFTKKFNSERIEKQLDRTANWIFYEKKFLCVCKNIYL